MLDTMLFFAVLLLGSAIFSGTETAFTSLNEIRVLNEKDSSGVRRLREMLRTKGSVIAAILVGNNIVNTVLAVYAGAFFDEVMVTSGFLSEASGPVAASIITIIFLLIFGEVIPKHFGVTFSRGWMKVFTWPLWLVVTILKPVTRLMDFFSQMLMNLLPVARDDGNSPTIQELLIMARYSANAGHIDEIERKLLVRATRFNDLEAGDVMVPRPRVVAVDSRVTFDQLQKEFKEHLFSRVPVFKDSIDNIVGVFNIKELITLSDEHRQNFDILRHCHEPFFAPEAVKIGQLFDQMKARKTHFSVIVDEFGATSGIITLEDVIERIFGLIHDEYDEETSQMVKKIGDNEFSVNGGISLEELEQALEIKLSIDDKQTVKTLNGLVIILLGDFPKVKDEAECEGLHIRVQQVRGMRATRLHITKKKRN
ncbi:MAG: hemolysin family protein [Candidatus Riflebacteria bacterium]